MLAVVLVCGLLGTVALGALAGARRTDMAYGRYLRAINSSDVFVNVPGPVLPAIRQVERLPGVASAAATVGLSANPIVNGKVNDAWLTHGLTGSLDGDGFRQDRMTVLAGRLPRQSATGEIALTVVVGAACAGRRVIVEVASIEVKGDRLRGEMMGAAAADWLLIGPEGTERRHPGGASHR